MPARKRSRKKLRRGAPWSLAEYRRLGKTPDSVLARRTGRTHQGSGGRTRAPAHPAADAPAPLDRTRNSNAGALFRRGTCPPAPPQCQRREATAPPLPHSSAAPFKSKKWTRAQEKLLGTKPDHEIAKTSEPQDLEYFLAPQDSWVFLPLCAPPLDPNASWRCWAGFRPADAPAETGHPLDAVAFKRQQLGRPSPIKS